MPLVTSTENIQQSSAKETQTRDWSTLAFAAVTFSAACVVFFGNLGDTPLFNPDEAYYTEPAREMNESGNYIITYLNYAVRHTKPPITIWMIAACNQMFGANEFAARFFGAACASVLVTVAALFARKYAGNRVSIFTSMILLSAPLFIGVGREAIADMPLALFTATALMSFFHAKMQLQQRWTWVGYALLGLAVMTKGPVGLVLPGAILFAFYFLRGELKEAWKFFKPIQGLLFTSVIALPWYVLAIYKSNGDYFREFILRENFQRFTSVVDHKAPWWYHIAAMFGGLLPWSVFLPNAVVSATTPTVPAKLSTAGAQNWLARNLQRFRNLDQREALLLFSLCTSSIVLAFFSASVSKLLPYTIPAFPAVAIMIACFIDSAIEKRQNKPFVIGFAVLSVAYAAGLFIAPHAIEKLRDCPPGLAAAVKQALCAMCGGAVIALIAASCKRLMLAIVCFATILIATTMYSGSKMLNILAEHWEVPAQTYAQFAGSSNWPIVIYQSRKPSMTYYARRKCLYTDDKQILQDTIKANANGYVVSRSKHTDYLKEIGCKILSVKGTSVLAMWKTAQ